MGSLRPGKCYSKINKKAYTRFSKRRPRKSYVKGVPASKIHHFEVGKKDEYGLKCYMTAKKDVQLRSNCMEALRVTVSKHLAKKLGEGKYFMKILVYPHHILREKSMATGAGADRFSQGMRQSFGSPTGQAARVKEGQSIVMVQAPTGSEAVVREAFRRGAAKLSGTYRVEMK